MVHILETNSQRRLNNIRCSWSLAHAHIFDVWYFKECAIILVTEDDDGIVSPEDARVSTLNYIQLGRIGVDVHPYHSVRATLHCDIVQLRR